MIRRAHAAGQRIIGVVNPSWDAVDDSEINDPNNEAAMVQTIAVMDAYQIPYVDGWQICKDHLNGGGHLSDLYSDTAHWKAAGHALVEEALKAYLPLGGSITLPGSRVYAASADFENGPVIKPGTGYDSRTGTWVDNGTSVSCTTPGSTITYSGIFRKFGVYRGSGVYPTVTVTIDGGAPITSFALYANGYDIGTRGAHTIVVEVTSSIEIDEFWAV